MRIGTVDGSPRPAGGQFLDWTLATSGATGVVEYDSVLRRDVFRCTGAGTANGYALLRKDLPSATPFVALRVIFEYGTDFALAGATHYIAKLSNAALAIMGGLQRFTSGVTMVKGYSGASLQSAYAGGDMRVAGLHEVWFYFQRDAAAGYVGCSGNCGTNNISRLNHAGGTSANDIARIEVGIMPESGGNFAGTVRFISVDVFDSMPDEIALCYADADRRFFAGVPALIEVNVPAEEAADAALAALGIDGPGHTGYNIDVSEATGTRSDAKAASARLVDAGVFTADDAHNGALVVFTARPFAKELPAQIIWTEANGTRAYLNRFHGALGVEAASYSSNGQTCEAQAYKLTRCVAPDPTNSPRKRWVGLPGDKLVAGPNTISVTFGETTVTRDIVVEAFSPPPPVPTNAHRKGLWLALGCDDNILNQTQLLRSVIAATTPRVGLYNSVITGTAHFYQCSAWGVINLLATLDFLPVSHLWDATNLSGYTAAIGRKLLDVSRLILRQQGHAPWMFVAPNGQFVSSDATNLLSYILGLYSITRASSSNWYTAWPQDPAAAVASRSIANNISAQPTDAAKAAEILSTTAGMAFAGGKPADALVSMNVHQVDAQAGNTSVGLVNAIIAEAVAQGIQRTSVRDFWLTLAESDSPPLALDLALSL